MTKSNDLDSLTKVTLDYVAAHSWPWYVMGVVLVLLALRAFGGIIEMIFDWQFDRRVKQEKRLEALRRQLEDACNERCAREWDAEKRRNPPESAEEAEERYRREFDELWLELAQADRDKRK